MVKDAAHPLTIHLEPPTGRPNKEAATAYVTLMLVVYAFWSQWSRRQAAAALIFNLVLPALVAIFDLTPGLTWKGVGPSVRAGVVGDFKRCPSWPSGVGLAFPWLPLCDAGLAYFCPS